MALQKQGHIGFKPTTLITLTNYLFHKLRTIHAFFIIMTLSWPSKQMIPFLLAMKITELRSKKNSSVQISQQSQSLNSH